MIFFLSRDTIITIFFFCYTISDLNVLREIYFSNNSFEFFLINFMLFYAIVIVICFCFLIKRIFLFLTKTQFIQLNLISHVNTTFFIRNQNFIKQQFATTGNRM